MLKNSETSSFKLRRRRTGRKRIAFQVLQCAPSGGLRHAELQPKASNRYVKKLLGGVFLSLIYLQIARH